MLLEGIWRTFLWILSWEVLQRSVGKIRYFLLFCPYWYIQRLKIVKSWLSGHRRFSRSTLIIIFKSKIIELNKLRAEISSWSLSLDGILTLPCHSLHPFLLLSSPTDHLLLFSTSGPCPPALFLGVLLPQSPAPSPLPGYPAAPEACPLPGSPAAPEPCPPALCQGVLLPQSPLPRPSVRGSCCPRGLPFASGSYY